MIITTIIVATFGAGPASASIATAPKNQSTTVCQGVDVPTTGVELRGIVPAIFLSSYDAACLNGLNATFLKKLPIF
jgi:hypothetical protein